jgi:hypothetical protein
MEHAAGATFQLMNPRGLYGAEAFFLLFALTLGFVVFRLLAFPHARRAPFRAWRAWRRWRAATAGLLLAGGVFALLFVSSVGGFHRVATRGDELLLEYSLPPREVVLPRADVRAFSIDPSFSGRARLVIEMRDGSTYRSVPARENLLAAFERRVDLPH